MFPHERSLVQRLADKPFALIGVNSDRDREQVKQLNKDQKITWRSFWNGGTGGAISSQYSVSAWPTICIIDAKGVIRYKYVGNPGDQQLDQAIDTLLKEIEKEGAGKTG